MAPEQVKIIECPRDAMQGIKEFIPTEKKVAYLNKLLQVGYYAIDFGSFVSHELIPQMADTAQVIDKLEVGNTKSKLIAIVANERGAQEAMVFPQIQCIGFPFSVSETFQHRNANSSIAESLERVKHILEICRKHGRELIIYVSMGFGNHYGDAYSPAIVEEWVGKLAGEGIKTFMLSDTVGVAGPEIIRYFFSTLIPAFPNLEIGAHLHTAPHNWRVKIDAAYESGCRRFDSAIMGFGGCPMADDDLIGNMPTEHLVNYFHNAQLGLDFDLKAFEACLREAGKVFGRFLP